MKSFQRFANRAALVTGSSSGIGAAIAQQFAREGASVVINYRSDREGAEATLGRVEAAGGRGLVVQADLARPVEAEALVARSIEQFGELHVLVNNAGIEINQPFVDVTEADYDRVLDVNLKGAFFATQAFVRILQRSGRSGKIINVSSVHEELPFPGFASYCASKGGLKMLTRNLAIELSPLGITVNAVAPGAIATPINASLLHDRTKLDALLAKIPLRRMGSPEDVANAVVFLASSAADYVTGTTLFVDGGLMWNYHEQ